ncbi:hypothetical protein AYO20_06531 [Fonsecaea nubica]|uniref:PQ loop repeat protein n=1 Tax=Fonsecaea nubica TaxID=856822 RepID=A0A178CZF7_9EURO|nr:hypothetical protein AYO20_06531 [Fonsecaea nubica]OAL34275.1 hypothetical protein AYO20_06531 [Fonsecaea nubica]
MGWLLICYIPQWGRIVARRSAEGLSTYYILLGSLSGVCAVGNIMMLLSSAVDIGCCRTNTRFACVSGLLGMLQRNHYLLADLLSRDFAELLVQPFHTITVRSRPHIRRAKRAWKVLVAACSFAFAVLMVSAIILHRFPWYAQAWADILGIAVAVFACIQWIPQVRTTWHLGHLRSLSPVSICLTAPYIWIFGINMMIRVGLKGWSAWIVYVLVGTMQIVLIVLAICFAVRDRRLAKQGKQHCATPANFEGWNTWGARTRTSSVVSRVHSLLALDEQSPLLYEQPSSRRQTIP